MTAASFSGTTGRSDTDKPVPYTGSGIPQPDFAQTQLESQVTNFLSLSLIFACVVTVGASVNELPHFPLLAASPRMEEVRRGP